jgi:hypothetical protein
MEIYENTLLKIIIFNSCIQLSGTTETSEDGEHLTKRLLYLLLLVQLYLLSFNYPGKVCINSPGWGERFDELVASKTQGLCDAHVPRLCAALRLYTCKYTSIEIISETVSGYSYSMWGEEYPCRRGRSHSPRGFWGAFHQHAHRNRRRVQLHDVSLVQLR